MEIIDRKQIIEYAKDKGLYIDLNNLSEKDRNNKNFKADPSKTELNDEIMLNAYYMLIEEKENEIKKGKKEIGDQKKKNESKQATGKGKKETVEQQMQ